MKGVRKRGVGVVALLLFWTAWGILLARCASPGPQRNGRHPPAPPPSAIPPAPRLPEVVSPPPLPVPPTEAAGIRPVRVRMEGIPSSFLVKGDSIRAWNTGGSLLAAETGSVWVSAAGDRIAWRGEKLFDTPIDVWAPGGLSLEGRRLPGRIRIAARNGRIRVVAVVPLEEYVAAVLSREAPPSFLPEALYAHAVAMRTYSLSAMASPRDPEYDVVAGVEDQVFEGVEDVASEFRAAAEATHGQVLQYRGRLSRTVYHSTCGGRTESALRVWGAEISYLRSVPCEDCRESPAWRWEYRMSREEGWRVALALGVRAGHDLRIEVERRTPSGRASLVRISSGGVSRVLKAYLLRREAGYANVKSLWMEIVPMGGGWLFKGNGYGHGVGMCQWGANGMAKWGARYPEILARYYPQTRIASLPGGFGAFARGAGGDP